MQQQPQSSHQGLGDEPEQGATVGDAATAEQPSGPGGNGQQEAAPDCTFCLQPLNDGAGVEALLCGHVVHSKCLAQFVEVAGKPKEESCPMKCHQTILLQSDDHPEAVTEDEEMTPRGSGEEQQEVEEDSEGEEATARIV